MYRRRALPPIFTSSKRPISDDIGFATRARSHVVSLCQKKPQISAICFRSVLLNKLAFGTGRRRSISKAAFSSTKQSIEEEKQPFRAPRPGQKILTASNFLFRNL